MGFVKLPDSLPQWDWFDDKNTVYVYIRLILSAAWEERDYKGVNLKRGQLVISQRDFANKCSVSRQELRTILNRLIATHKITQTATSKFSVVTVLDYDCTTQKSTCKTTTKQPTINPPSLYNTDIQNNRNTDSDKTGEAESDYNFNSFWMLYPKKTAKQQALKAWLKIKPDNELFHQILSALELQKQSVQWQKDGGQFIPYPATWLNGERWKDEINELPLSENKGSNKTERDYSTPIEEILKNL